MGRKKHSIVDLLLVSLLLAAVVCGWHLYSDYRTGVAADAAVGEMHELKPSIDEGEGASDGRDFGALQTGNPDIIAWLAIPGTVIDYPVVQTSDNDFYLSHDAQKNINTNGALFLDYRAHPDFSDFVNVIYGHHMQSGIMFQNLMNFKDQTFFDNQRIGTLYTPEKTWQLEFFATAVVSYDSDIYDYTLSSPAEKEAYFEGVKEVALQYRDIDLSASDRIVVLSTCSYEYADARSVVLARLV